MLAMLQAHTFIFKSLFLSDMTDSDPREARHKRTVATLAMKKSPVNAGDPEITT
jgi:hypothetical protein